MKSSDVAKLAGVSRSTVSKVINDYPNIPKETKDRVWKVIKESGYVPNSSAQRLAGKASKILGIFIVDLDNTKDENRVVSSPYFSSLIAALIDKTKQKGYNVLVSEILEKEDFEQCHHLFSSKTISGGIFLGVKINDDELKKLIERNYKIVFIDKRNEKKLSLQNINFINPENTKGAAMATQYLIDKGHSKIAHITGDLLKLSSQERLEAFRKTMKKNNLELEEKYIENGHYNEEGGYEATKKILKRCKPTAIFSGNDSMAIGAIKAISEKGLRIPEDISIIGFDNVPLAKYSTPSLTTINVSIMDLGEKAVDSLLKIIDGENKEGKSYRIKTNLIERKSVKELK